MSDFCRACSEELFGKDFKELANLCKPDQMCGTICEGCGHIWVDHLGNCVTTDCLKKGKPGHGKSETWKPFADELPPTGTTFLLYRPGHAWPYWLGYRTETDHYLVGGPHETQRLDPGTLHAKGFVAWKFLPEGP